MIDIIIPVYNDKQGLIKTLTSITKQLLNYSNVIVIDDYSDINYDDIKIKFPFIILYKLQKNQGPGMARQFGINHSKQPYILFMDAGDIFISQEIQSKIITTINLHSNIQIFSWSHLCNNTNQIQQNTHNRLHGRIYKRSFLQKYNITFSQEGSRANEDVGFNKICRLILKQYYTSDAIYESNEPMIIWYQGENSITQKDNYAFAYKNSILGLAINEQHVFNICKQNNVSNEILQVQADRIIVYMYKKFYLALLNRPEYVQNVWEGAYRFYHNIYYKYENSPSPQLQIALSHLIKLLHSKNIPINLHKFLFYLKENKNCPTYYLTLI